MRILLALVLVLAGCAQVPDTRLHPSPPAVTYAPERHPFRGARLYLDTDTAALRYQTANGATWLTPITSQPQARWLNGPADLAPLGWIAPAARRQGALLVLVAYYLPGRGCEARQGAPTPEAYDRWIGRMIRLLGPTRAVIVMEPDALAGDCFGGRRAALLKREVKRLADAGQYVYLDAGHSGWRPTGEMAQRLLDSGIQYAEGFAVNVSNRQWANASYRWGRELSDLVGGREFVIDTSRNGLGPPPGDAWCNPQRQALGGPPRVDPGLAGLAAYLWIKRPGESDGVCGGETTWEFSPRQARILISQK